MNAETLQFLLTVLMELATLACAYLGVRLYKLSRKVRMTIICIPLLINLALYAAYSSTTFVYLAIILILCIPFAWARKSA